jgi:hypothetical protein
MKTVLSIAAFAALAGSAFAQLSSLPPSSTTEGIAVNPEGVNAGATHWDNPSTLGAYKAASTTDGNAPITTPAYNPLGLPFASTVPTAVASFKSQINTSGGTIRGIYVAESAGWQNDFGYTYSGNPAGPNSYTVFQNIQGNPADGPTTVSFGQYFDVPLSIGQASNFDFWLNGVGAMGTANPTPPTDNGGVYTAFNQANSSSFINGGNVLWSQTPLLVNTFVPALGAYVDVATYLVAFEDWRQDRGSDRDFSDLIVGVQFFNANGLPFAPVPEPSTYGLIGAAALLGLIARRRFKKSAVPATV